MKANKKEFVDVLYGRLYGVEIVDEVYSRDTSEADPEDSWDRPNTSTDHNIVGFNAASEDQEKYYDLVVPFDPNHGENYYVLYCVYSTGDSFGHDEGRGIEYIGFYKKDQLHIANENRGRIENHSRNGKNDEYSIMLRDPSGTKVFEQSTPWTGYFESLDYCDIKETRREQ